MLTNETIRTIQNRRSIRQFKREQITGEELQTILEAALLAPYAAENSRHFTVIQNKDVIDKLSLEAKTTALNMDMPGLSEIARDNGFHCLYHAPTVIIVSGNEQTPGSEMDCAASTQNILLAAESIGLGSCWVFFTMAAFFSPSADELKRELQIPVGFKPLISIAVGYKENLPSDRPNRKPDAIVRINPA
jgi:nitroreductase